ncbi:hypothetical protein ADUPG1_006199 [Aduncisulcus paluster]|uniref:Reverse transcriptase domain-containing protein n=2 Tax=Aduncisulcus paluster TaxID=2918883 RepID=A0ABQ5KLP8_9EUKA|nr:hypothetical protein ADUPG1_006199 [Aduncisulcus paluster]
MSSLRKAPSLCLVLLKFGVKRRREKTSQPQHRAVCLNLAPRASALGRFRYLKQAINPASPASAPTSVISEYVERYTEEPEDIAIPPSRFTGEKLRINSVTVKEVYACLKGLNSASGPDGMTAKSARTFSPGVWTTLFNRILEKEIIPSQWRHIRARGIDKENGKPDDDMGRWRPLFIANVGLRLLSAILARRMTQWTSYHRVISEYQVGFFPVNGTTLNIFKARDRLHRKEIAVSIDLTDAFGSVHHSLLSSVIDDLTEGSFRSFLHNISKPIINLGGSSKRIIRGCPQGSPLSPLLFNLCLDRAIRDADIRANILGYADDIISFGKNQEECQERTDRLILQLKNVSFEVNPSKCFSISADYMSVDGSPIPRGTALVSKYLGIGIEPGVPMSSACATQFQSALVDARRIPTPL